MRRSTSVVDLCILFVLSTVVLLRFLISRTIETNYVIAA